MRSAFTFLLLLLGSSALLANNITVSNTGLNGQNTTAHFTQVLFDAAWENSWRTSTNESNYDGAWIFVKYRKNGTADWRHCTLAATGHTAASGAALSIPSDGKGAFLYRSADGLGNVSFAGNKLQWNYGVDGVLDNETVEIRVFAVEMVYIPQGAFYAGSGGTERNAFYTYGSTANAAYNVASNAAINVGAVNGQLFYNNEYNSGYPNYFPGGGDGTGPVPVAFPKGYNAFWIMKYECSQQQYVDFLNLLDAARASVRNKPDNFFSGSHPAIAAPKPETALSYRTANDLLAYADWAGLRPYSELEYEKASRGRNNPPVPNEYAWGNTTIQHPTATTGEGTATASVSTPATANANWQLGYALRCGIFARPSGSTRTLSGGTYYGVMDMTGSVAENCISIGSPESRAVTAGTHGDGYLTAQATTDITVWTAASLIFRGGHYDCFYTSQYLPVSSRWIYDATLQAGIRLARTAE